MKELLNNKRREFLKLKNNFEIDEPVRISNSKLFDIFNSMFHNDRYQHQDELIDNLINHLHMNHLQIERLKDRNSDLVNELEGYRPEPHKFIPDKGLNERRRFD